MVVRLRLARFGKKRQPMYKIFAADARCPRDGRHLEVRTSDPASDCWQGTRSSVTLACARSLTHWLVAVWTPGARVLRRDSGKGWCVPVVGFLFICLLFGRLYVSDSRSATLARQGTSMLA